MPNRGPRVELLHSLRVVVEGKVVDRLPTRRLEALLAYLVLHPTWQPREKVAEAIWPDLPEGKALASLRNALSVLRRVLDSELGETATLIESTRTHARVSRSNIQCDVWEFEAAVGNRDNALAISIYAGELLPHIYDEWLNTFRETLRFSFHRAISCESARLLKEGAFDLAVECAQKWRMSDPYEVEASRVLVLSLAGGGHRQAALAMLDKLSDEFATGVEILDVAAIRTEIDSFLPIPKDISWSNAPEWSTQLPLYLSQFFGRAAELRQIADWMSRPSQLLTIAGLGGVGKTRLAIEAGRMVERELQIVFVSLASAETGDDVIRGITTALELPDSQSESPIRVIAHYLKHRTKRLLLILDNLEQVVEPAATVVLSLLRATQDLKVLCTSREMLGIEGEQRLSLLPLETSVPLGLDDWTRFGKTEQPTALQMFVDRARNTRSDFALNSLNYLEVVALCEELDGIPLAIEIVAGWSGAWSVSEMRDNVRSQKVVARKRGHDPRHQSLAACIEWSFDLLDSATREFLCVLSLFRGGWSLEAAKAVSGAPDAIGPLAALVDRSLVSSTEVEGGLRFFMVETVRNYCRLQLAETELRSAGPRFVKYYRELARRLANPCAGAAEQDNHRRLDRERDNVEAAVQLCEMGAATVDDGLALLGELQLHWTYRGQARAGIALLERLLSIDSDETRGFGRILGLQALSILTQDIGAADRTEQALGELQALAETQDSEEARFRVLTQMGNYHLRFGRFAAAVIPHTRAYELAMKLELPRMLAVAQCNLAESLFGMDRITEAMGLWAAATELDALTGNVGGEAMLFLGFTEVLSGNVASGSRRLQLYLRNVVGLNFGRGYSRVVRFSALPAALVGKPKLARQLLDVAQRFSDQESFVFDALESKCLEFVQLAIARDLVSAEPQPEVPRNMEEAMVFLDEFLGILSST